MKKWVYEKLVPFLAIMAIFIVGELLGYPFRQYGDLAWIVGGIGGLILLGAALFVVFLLWRVFVKFARWALTD